MKKKEKTVDNIGFITSIILNAFPSWSLSRQNMYFVSPFECTGKPAVADEFWLDLTAPFFYKTSLAIALTEILNNCPEHKQVKFIEYSGKVYYSNLDGNTNKYKMKCFFYTERLINGKEKNLLRLNGKIMIKVDLYHEWEDKTEISRFELMEIEK